MTTLLFLLFSCSETPTKEPVLKTGEPSNVVKTKKSKKSKKGVIEGFPILPNPTILGDIENRIVEQKITAKMDAINRCFQQEKSKNQKLFGKVLVRFTIAKNGEVSTTRVLASSLRHPPTEDCIQTELSTLKFPSLNIGDKAIVSYPFVFPKS